MSRLSQAPLTYSNIRAQINRAETPIQLGLAFILLCQQFLGIKKVKEDLANNRLSDRHFNLVLSMASLFYQKNEALKNNPPEISAPTGAISRDDVAAALYEASSLDGLLKIRNGLIAAAPEARNYIIDQSIHAMFAKKLLLFSSHNNPDTKDEKPRKVAIIDFDGTTVKVFNMNGEKKSASVRLNDLLNREEKDETRRNEIKDSLRQNNPVASMDLKCLPYVNDLVDSDRINNYVYEGQEQQLSLWRQLLAEPELKLIIGTHNEYPAYIYHVFQLLGLTQDERKQIRIINTPASTDPVKSAIIDQVCREYGLTPKDIYFIDDHSPAVEAANRKGCDIALGVTKEQSFQEFVTAVKQALRETQIQDTAPSSPR